MNKSKLIAIVAVVVLVVAGAAYALTQKASKTDTSTTTATSSSNMQDMPMNNQSNQQTAESDAVATDKVSIQNFAFSPSVITVKAGTTVTWTNQDEVHHSVTVDSGSDGPNSQLFGKGESYSYTFTKAGTYKYHCMPHPYMHGTVIVTE